MGYHTDFSGEFSVTPTLKLKHKNYLNAFAKTRRMKRNEALAEELTDKVRLKVALPIGHDGAYFVGNPDDYGQSHDASIIDYNCPPYGQPGLWCQWMPNEDGDAILWDGVEKFYNYVQWIEYIIKNFLAPWGYKLNGEVEWHGEDHDDIGKIVIKDNVVTTKSATINWN